MAGDQPVYTLLCVEENLPPPSPPVQIQAPDLLGSTDREQLASCLQELARRVKTALEKDYESRRKYACRMKLYNQIGVDGNGEREEYSVKLPLAASCWNDVDTDTIEFCLINCIVKQVPNIDHVWHKIEAAFDDYIDPLAKFYLEKLDEGDETLETIQVPPELVPREELNRTKPKAKTVLRKVAISSRSHDKTSDSSGPNDHSEQDDHAQPPSSADVKIKPQPTRITIQSDIQMEDVICISDEDDDVVVLD